MLEYSFPEPLIEGIIVERRNRFIVDVRLGEEVHVCHCPCTGKIGNFDLRGRPCLLSKSDGKNRKRKTLYTMEAVSLNRPNDRHKAWIGVNQNANNRYVEYFLEEGALSDMVGNVREVLREQKLGNSKIDFLVGDCFLEVKSPLWRIDLEVPDYISTHDNGVFGSYERLFKHLNSFGSCMKPYQKAILLVCFVYDNPGMKVNRSSRGNKKVYRLMDKCSSLERWQINLRISKTGVRLIRYFPLDL